MKSKAILFLAAILMTGAAAIAQTTDHVRVKILATENPGVLKLVYGKEMNEEEPLEIRISNSSGVLASDKITGSFEKGFLKKYNLQKVFNSTLWFEITSKEMSVVYRVTPTKKGTSFVAQVERVSYHNAYYASRN